MISSQSRVLAASPNANHCSARRFRELNRSPIKPRLEPLDSDELPSPIVLGPADPRVDPSTAGVVAPTGLRSLAEVYDVGTTAGSFGTGLGGGGALARAFLSMSWRALLSRSMTDFLPGGSSGEGMGLLATSMSVCRASVTV